MLGGWDGWGPFHRLPGAASSPAEGPAPRTNSQPAQESGFHRIYHVMPGMIPNGLCRQQSSWASSRKHALRPSCATQGSNMHGQASSGAREQRPGNLVQRRS